MRPYPACGGASNRVGRASPTMDRRRERCGSAGFAPPHPEDVDPAMNVDPSMISIFSFPVVVERERKRGKRASGNWSRLRGVQRRGFA